MSKYRRYKKVKKLTMVFLDTDAAYASVKLVEMDMATINGFMEVNEYIV